MKPAYQLEKLKERSDWPEYDPTDYDALFLKLMRQMLGQKEITEKECAKLDQVFQYTSFPKAFDRIGIVVYQPGSKRLLVVRRIQQPWYRISSLIKRVKQHERSKEFGFADEEQCRIQLEFILSPPRAYSFEDLYKHSIGAGRFEIGVDGLRLAHGDQTAYFLPGDAFVRSIIGPGQLTKYIKRQFKDLDLSELSVKRFRSKSYVSYKGQWLRLYRGYPVVEKVTKRDIERAVDLAINHVIKYQQDDGRFLYYYCSAADSQRDHEHPTRNPETDPYYNILRHAGGGILLLLAHLRSNNDGVAHGVRKSIDYLLEQVVEYELPTGQKAGYVYYNKKGKLGGQGIGLYLLSEYQRITGDKTYQSSAELLKNHLVAQVTESGEFIYYNIYLDKPVAEKDNAKHFSFYYPGEAIIGLVTYCKYVETSKEEKSRILDAVTRALRFLFLDRKDLYAEHYTTLPSDGWLMMAVNELWDIAEARESLYTENVFKDADSMVEMMYTVEDGLYADYPGSFYYKYGDIQYADGARCEGLLGGYLLARKCGDHDRTERYGNALIMAAWATFHLVNTPESLYFAKNPEQALGGIRFKFNRQWFRVDTIQHVAAFYLKFLPYWEEHCSKAVISSEGKEASNEQAFGQLVFKLGGEFKRARQLQSLLGSAHLTSVQINDFPRSHAQHDSFILTCQGGIRYFLKRLKNRSRRKVEQLTAELIRQFKTVRAPRLYGHAGDMLLYEYLPHSPFTTHLQKEDKDALSRIYAVVEDMDAFCGDLYDCAGLKAANPFSIPGLLNAIEKRKVKDWKGYDTLRQFLHSILDLKTDTNQFVHGDLRLENFLLADNGGTYLIDWEFAQLADRNLDYATLYVSGIKHSPTFGVDLLNYLKGRRYFDRKKFLLYCISRQVKMINRESGPANRGFQRLGHILELFPDVVNSAQVSEIATQVLPADMI